MLDIGDADETAIGVGSTEGDANGEEVGLANVASSVSNVVI
jgi:hypothetical protein